MSEGELLTIAEKVARGIEIQGKTTSWNPIEMLGLAPGRAIAHEARHEYIGLHADTGFRGLNNRSSPILKDVELICISDKQITKC